MNEEKTPTPFAEVLGGPDKGRRINLFNGTITLGRASENSVCLIDPILSRHHCKIVCKRTVFQIFDLDSANGTFLNDVEIKDAILHDGDRVRIGDTIIHFSIQGTDQTSFLSSIPTTHTSENGKDDSGVIIDLGFDNKNDSHDQNQNRQNMRPLIWGLIALVILLIGASLILRVPEKPTIPKNPTQNSPSLLPFEVDYEKVEASTNSVFRYHISLNASGFLVIEIDDLAEDRHIRKDAMISSNSIERLAKQIERSGLFLSDNIPEGISPDGSITSMRLSIVSNRKVKKLKVMNRVEPKAFQEAREALETFGRNELGIWAIQYPKEKLIEMALECCTHARNLYEERDIDHGNIFHALKSYREAQFYLETIDPKPEFHGNIVSECSIAEKELNSRYEEQRFKADRAINLKEWQTAAMELRILREQIPDENDLRNIDAKRKLYDVEGRINHKN